MSHMHAKGEKGMWHQQIQILKKKVKQLERTESKNGILEVEGFIDSNRPRTMQGQAGINGGGCRSVKTRSTLRSGIEVDSVNIPIKSNLKNNTLSQHFMTTEMRKVSWSDAYGKDIAHVQEFEPSEQGELEGAGKACRCTIQ